MQPEYLGAYSRSDSIREYKLMRSRDYADKIDDIITVFLFPFRGSAVPMLRQH